jgi:hypothetical protein
MYCFGTDENGNYGIWFSSTFQPAVNLGNLDTMQTIGFIPIIGKGVPSGPLPIGPIPPLTPSYLTNLGNLMVAYSITASNDGKVWMNGRGDVDSTYMPWEMFFKSPGAIDSNWVGGWQQVNTNFYYGFNDFFYPDSPFIYDSYPRFGYWNSTQVLVYDNHRQAFYALFAQNVPDLSQNMDLYLMISRNNGESWSQPYYISTTSFANRGQQSLALNQKFDANGNELPGDLVFGWYDGRNDKTLQSVEYYGAVLPAKKLDKLVNAMPASNPIYITGSAT